MKKAVVMIFALAMLFSLYACSKDDGHSITEPPASELTTEPTECSHSWEDATCTEPKTCKTCGITEGSEAAHNWKSATCKTPKTCKACGKTEGSVAAHNWKNATCKKAATCSVCGATGKKGDHDYEILAEQGDGKFFARKVHKKCKTCDLEKTLYYTGKDEFDLEAIYKTLEDYAKSYGLSVSDSFDDVPYYKNIQKGGFMAYESYMDYADRNGPKDLIRLGKNMIDTEYKYVKNSTYPMSAHTIHLYVGYGESASTGGGAFNVWVTLTFKEP